MQHFDLTEQHLKLLQRANVYWEDAESGAPAIDPKRPYGNSDVTTDVLEILGVEPANRCRNCGDEYSPEQKEMAAKLHRETELALQVILSARSFEPGHYFEQRFGKWERVG